MRKSTKIITSCCAALVVCCAITAVCIIGRSSQSDNPTDSQTVEQNVYVISSTHDLAIDISNPTEMGRVSTYVALVKIDSIDGTNNYSEVSQEYVLPYTYGHMTVLESIAGDLPTGESLEFYRLGGTISSDGDVDIEAGKTYLVYLVDETAYYAKPGTYAIIGFEGGLREVRTNSGEVATQSTTEPTNMQVLNNFTGEWESLNSVLSAQ